MAAALPRSQALRRLGAEMEIWLHEHAVNRLRSERGELPVTGLWLWGGGTLAPAPRVPCACRRPMIAPLAAIPYLEGLWCARGARVEALPESLADLAASPGERSVVLVDICDYLAAERRAEHRRCPRPPRCALGGAGGGSSCRAARCGGLTVIANDRCLTLGRRDALKRWRRARRGLAALA